MTTANRRLLMAASRPIDVLRKFTFDRTGGNANISTCTAKIKRLRGNTIVWNQLLKTFANADIKPSDVNYVYNEQKITLTGWNPYAIYRFNAKLTERINHKFYIRIDAVITSTKVQLQLSSGNNREYLKNGTNRYIKVCENLGTDNNIDYINIFHIEPAGTVIDAVFNNFMCIDLTLMFGAGNEPTSVEEFESMFPLDYYDYNAGQLLSFTGDEIKTTGFNQWDEQWELGGLNGSNGQKIRDDSRIRTKNYIPVLPSTQYYIKFPQFTPNNIGTICYYDANKNFIYATYPVNSSPFADTPAGAWYMLITFYPAYGTTYNYDICVNISHNGTKNGTYEEYEQHTKDISFYKSIKDGQGNTLFPYGLLSAGSVYDEVTATKAIKRIGHYTFTGNERVAVNDWRHFDGFYASLFSTSAFMQDRKPVAPTDVPNAILNRLSPKKYNDIYNGDIGFTVSSNATSTNTYSFVIRVTSNIATNDTMLVQWLAGQTVYYELAEPIEVPLDNINLEYPAYRTGTEELLPANGAVPITTPALFDIRYKIGGRRN